MNTGTIEPGTPPYPPHTPPPAPEGMKWEYRGKGWRSVRSVEYYAVEIQGGEALICHAQGPTSAVPSNYYFEAVPNLEDLKEVARLAELAESRKKVQEVFESPPPFAEILQDSGFVFGKTTLKDVLDANPRDPKGEAAAHKAPLHLLPSFPLHETAHVMQHGAGKYGPWNFRKNPIKASVYRSAMQRHLDQWFDGLEDTDEETSRSHIAHVIASACIVMDAMKHGTLVDDRPRQ